MSVKKVVYLLAEDDKDMVRKASVHFTPMEKDFLREGVEFEMVIVDEVENLSLAEQYEIQKLLMGSETIVVGFVTATLLSRLVICEKVNEWLEQSAAAIIPVIMRKCSWQNVGNIFAGRRVATMKPVMAGDFDELMVINVEALRVAIEHRIKRQQRTWECSVCKGSSTDRISCTVCGRKMPIPVVFLVAAADMLSNWRYPIRNNLQQFGIVLWSVKDIVPGHDMKEECLSMMEQADVMLFLLSPSVNQDEENFTRWLMHAASVSGCVIVYKIGVPMYWQGISEIKNAKPLGDTSPLSQIRVVSDAAYSVSEELAQVILK